MKIKNLEDVLGQASHDVKSPLSSAKSLIFLANVKLAKKQNIKDDLSKIEEKLNLLNKRIDSFFDFVYFREDIFDFAYEFFDLVEILHIKNKKQLIIMADKKYLAKALNLLINDAKVSVKDSGKEFVISFFREIDIDKEKDKAGFITVEKIIKLHGGKIKRIKEKEYEVVLPHKAKKVRIIP